MWILDNIINSPKEVYPQDCKAGLSVISAEKEPIKESKVDPQDSQDSAAGLLNVISAGKVSPQKSSVVYPRIQGRLRERLGFWETLQPPPMVLDIVKQGYILPFFSLPTPAQFKNHASAGREGEFVKESIDSLLWNGCIEEVAIKPMADLHYSKNSN